jgi:hypothetical protein
MDEDPTTQELRKEQLQREQQEREEEEEAGTGAEAEQHGRRAEKAEYLREKLQERAEAERSPEG